MKSRKWICSAVAMMVALSSFAIFAKAQGRGHEDKEERKERKEDRKERKKDRHEGYYSDHNRDEIRGWYNDHQRNLPPGLAKRDELPPGLARQLRVRGTLPPGLRREMHPCPPELVRYLPPPPPDCDHVLIGGNIVLVNRRTFVVLDIMALFR